MFPPINPKARKPSTLPNPNDQKKPNSKKRRNSKKPTHKRTESNFNSHNNFISIINLNSTKTEFLFSERQSHKKKEKKANNFPKKSHFSKFKETKKVSNFSNQQFALIKNKDESLSKGSDLTLKKSEFQLSEKIKFKCDLLKKKKKKRKTRNGNNRKKTLRDFSLKFDKKRKFSRFQSASIQTKKVFLPVFNEKKTSLLTKNNIKVCFSKKWFKKERSTSNKKKLNLFKKKRSSIFEEKKNTDTSKFGILKKSDFQTNKGLKKFKKKSKNLKNAKSKKVAQKTFFFGLLNQGATYKHKVASRYKRRKINCNFEKQMNEKTTNFLNLLSKTPKYKKFEFKDLGPKGNQITVKRVDALSKNFGVFKRERSYL